MIWEIGNEKFKKNQIFLKFLPSFFWKFVDGIFLDLFRFSSINALGRPRPSVPIWTKRVTLVTWDPSGILSERVTYCDVLQFCTLSMFSKEKIDQNLVKFFYVIFEMGILRNRVSPPNSFYQNIFCEKAITSKKFSSWYFG